MIKKGVIYILPGTSNINKQKLSIQNESPTSEKGNPTQTNTTQQNNIEQALTQEQRLILTNLKRILNSKDHFTIIKKH